MSRDPGPWLAYTAVVTLLLAGWWATRRRPRVARPSEAPCAVYRLYGPDRRRPLRIGHTDNVTRRMGQYRREAWWWPQVVGDPVVRWYPNRPAALAAEADAIRREAPLYNDKHNGGNGGNGHVSRGSVRDAHRPAVLDGSQRGGGVRPAHLRAVPDGMVGSVGRRAAGRPVAARARRSGTRGRQG